MAVGMGPWNFGSEVEKIMLEAARLHARLHPYIYSAAIDAYESGFPWTMTPLSLAFPNDPQVYGRENIAVRGYQWMIGPTLLACPLYGNDYATATTRDVYLPAGKWMDHDTGDTHTGPKLLVDFPLPVGKTPLFVGGKGVVVLRELPGDSLAAVVYPVAPRGTSFRFTHRDGATRSAIEVANSSWTKPRVMDVSDGKSIAFQREEKTGAIRFAIVPGHNYQVQD
jgi:alpha-glucosidase (family GH31 glycosyl hydrolase)